MNNAKLFAQSVLYHLPGEFSTIGKFLSRLDDLFTLDTPTLKALHIAHKNLKQRIEDYHTHDESYVLDVLALREFEKIFHFLQHKTNHQTCCEHFDITASLQAYNNTIHDFFRERGIPIEKPPLFFVDTYPDPNPGQHSIAVTFNYDCEKQFGTPHGIYFKNDFLRPFYSIYLLFHEYIHLAKLNTTNHLIGGPLEEGLAEFYGCLFLSLQFFGYETTKNLFHYHRLYGHYDKGLDLYLDYCRQAYSIYLEYGLLGIEHLIKLPRTDMRKIENQITLKGLKKLDIPQGNWNDELNELAQELLLQTSKNRICNPVAYMALPHCQRGDNISEIAAKLEIPLPLLQDSLQEITDAPRLLDIHEGAITASDAPYVLNHRQLKYSIR